MSRSASAAVEVAPRQALPGGEAASGFRIDHVQPAGRRPAAPATTAATTAAKPALRAVAGSDDPLPPDGRFAAADPAVTNPAVTVGAAEPAWAVAAAGQPLPIDGTWRWLGRLACLLSAAFTLTILTTIIGSVLG
jgi:hypothetical protein